MLHPRTYSIALALALIMAAVPSPGLGARVGGPCSYQDYPGRISIIAVNPVPQPESKQARLPYQPHEVFFVFTPSAPVAHSLHQPGKAHALTLAGGQPVGPEFLKKYGIRPGVSFKADLHLISAGTCSPVVFTFHGIDVYDRVDFSRR